MPFQSKAQQRFMFSQHPEIAKRWAAVTPSFSSLPQHVKRSPRDRLAKAIANNRRTNG